MSFLYFCLMRTWPIACERSRLIMRRTRDLALQDFAGGPFADRSGGLITFDIASGEEAERLVADDPFLREDLLERHWLEQWMIDREEPRG
jgi:hypothetical protein